MFNIGVEGQFIMGAMGATVAVLALRDLPPPVLLLLALAIGTLTGAAWGFIPGFLKARTGAHEVITTIMLNYVAAQLVLFGLRSDFLRQPGNDAPISKVLSTIVRVPLIFELPAIRLHYGFIVALIMAAIVSCFMFKTTKGFELRAAGFNLHAARYAGHERRRLDHAGDDPVGRPRRPGRVVRGPRHGRPDVQRPERRLRLQRHRARPAGRQQTAGDRRGRPALRGAADRRRIDAGARPGSRWTSSSFIQALVIMFVAAPVLVRSIYRMKARPLDEGSPI